jgi:hypothetical protein
MTKAQLIARADQLGNVGPLTGWTKEELRHWVARLEQAAVSRIGAA